MVEARAQTLALLDTHARGFHVSRCIASLSPRVLWDRPIDVVREEAKLAGEENEFRTEADVLNVSDTEFWFSAYIRHTDIEVVSEQQRIDELAKLCLP